MLLHYKIRSVRKSSGRAEKAKTKELAHEEIETNYLVFLMAQGTYYV